MKTDQTAQMCRFAGHMCSLVGNAVPNSDYILI